MFLVFQLKAPLASFGATPGELRATALSPRKSTILGLLAAALGITRDEPDMFKALGDAVAAAVVEMSKPSILSDYHTIEAPASIDTRLAARLWQLPHSAVFKELNPKKEDSSALTVLTTREYLQDGHWLVALEANEALLHSLCKALQSPKFTLYLGRKSCVLSKPLAPLIVDAKTVEDSFFAWMAQALKYAPRNAPMWWEPSMATNAKPLISHTRTDHRTALMQNTFKARTELEGKLPPQLEQQ